MVTSWKDPNEPGSSSTIATNTTVAHRQRAKNTYGKARQIFENYATMDKAIKQQIIETIEDAYIT